MTFPSVLKKIFYVYLYTFYMYFACLYVCVTTSVPGAQGGAQDIREPEAGAAASHVYGAGVEPGLAEPTLQPSFSLMATLWGLTGA